MKRTMSAEHKAKLKQSMADAAAKYAAQVIAVDDNWRIRRADALNWEIQEKVKGAWQFRGYYGKLIAAFNALPAHMLQDKAQKSLEDCQICLNDLSRSIRAALPEANAVLGRESEGD